MAKISLSNEVAKRAKKKFPDYDVEIDGETVLRLRNVIRLSRAERKEYNGAAGVLQTEIREALQAAQDADEDSTEAVQAILEANDGLDMYVNMLRKQLEILAVDKDEAVEILGRLEYEQIAALHSICSEGVGQGE
jgi:hypothetical protein